ncbi:MAG: MOSC domain-containing protein [Epsilonproteobacteria bacterium]|nr:MOSC domain-containing protein [Campylobacterota bacterium]
MKIAIENIFCATKERTYNTKTKTFSSSYQKKTLHKNHYSVTHTGFTLDTQSDKQHHGGIDKAVCVYSQKYYHYLESKYNITLPLCAFGENLSIVGVDDSNICLGDQFICGSVLFEVSQPRQPCWKISSILGIKNLTATIVKEAKTGFYFRVIKEGVIKPTDRLELVSRVHPKFTIEFINHIAYNAKAHQESILAVLQCDELAQAYHTSLSKRYKNKEQGIQNWQLDT